MPSDLPMICEERSRLLRKYSDAASTYAESVREMADLLMAGEDVRAAQTRRFCRVAWDETEKSRLALYRHEADHNCVVSDRVRNIPEA